MLAKCKAGLVDYQVGQGDLVSPLQANVNTIDVCKFASDMINEAMFKNGLHQQLVPWMDQGEVRG